MAAFLRGPLNLSYVTANTRPDGAPVLHNEQSAGPSEAGSDDCE